MRLEGEFYRVARITDDGDGSYVVTVVMEPKHQIYEGHFPGQPVVPGVCTLTIIRECLGEILGREVSFTTIKECKYVSALIPEEGLSITLNLAITDATKLRATVERCDNRQTVLKLRAEIR